MLRKIRYLIEAIITVLVVGFFYVLPLDIASAVGGRIARVLGPLARGANRTAKNNLAHAFPEMTEKQRKRILRDMWDNLGRVVGEYSHLSSTEMHRRITVEGREHFESLKASGKGAVFISGHFANWEIAPLTCAINGVPLVLIYRRPNNPLSDWIVRRLRRKCFAQMYGKGREGAQQILKALRSDKSVGLLVDQKMNEGEALPFFGRPAPTAIAPALLATKNHAPMFYVRTVRTDGAYFHFTLMPSVQHAPDADPVEIMAEVNRLFESWIREHPAQWLWIHNRWNSKE